MLLNVKLVPQEFYFDETELVAKRLLGKILCVKDADGKVHKSRIVETEAYLGIEDRAAHTFNGRRTARVEAMWMDGGHSYVYLIYGMYFCLNFVTKTTEHPEAVLIRAVEPFPHVEMKKKDMKTNGPGKLCKALGITKEHNALKLWKKNSEIYLCEDDFEVRENQIVACPRIGVDYAGEAALWPLRFYLRGNKFISKE
ncbi:3-methyladenine DNA glycosylase [compost metagenome]